MRAMSEATNKPFTRPGPIGKALREELRESDDMSRALREIAFGAADLADVCRKQGDGRGFLAAIKEVRAILGTLEPKRRTDDDSDEGNNRGSELARELGAGPSVGDPSDA